jgi:hypothetical protein
MVLTVLGSAHWYHIQDGVRYDDAKVSLVKRAKSGVAVSRGTLLQFERVEPPNQYDPLSSPSVMSNSPGTRIHDDNDDNGVHSEAEFKEDSAVLGTDASSLTEQPKRKLTSFQKLEAYRWRGPSAAAESGTSGDAANWGKRSRDTAYWNAAKSFATWNESGDGNRHKITSRSRLECLDLTEDRSWYDGEVIQCLADLQNERTRREGWTDTAIIYGPVVVMKLEGELAHEADLQSVVEKHMADCDMDRPYALVLHMNGNHWCTALFVHSLKEIRWYDSLNPMTLPAATKTNFLLLVAQAVIIMHGAESSDTVMTGWRMTYPACMPGWKQNDGSGCGPLTVEVTNRLSSGQWVDVDGSVVLAYRSNHREVLWNGRLDSFTSDDRCDERWVVGPVLDEPTHPRSGNRGPGHSFNDPIDQTGDDTTKTSRYTHPNTHIRPK